MTCLARATFEFGDIGPGVVQAIDEFKALNTAYTTAIVGSPVVQNTTFKNGAYALKCPTGANVARFNCGALASTTIHFHKFWFQFHKQGSFTAKNFWAMDAGGFGFHVGLQFNSSYNMVATNNEASPSTVTGTIVFTEDTWYEVQVECRNANSPDGYIKVWINGTLDISLTSVDLIRSVGAVGEFRLGANAANGEDYFFDSYFFNDNQGSTHNTMPPLGRSLLFIRPNGNGTANQYTSSTSSPTHSDDVDDDPVNIASSSDRLTSTTLNNIESFNFADVSGLLDFSAFIHSVTIHGYIRNGTNPRQQLLIRTHSTDYLSGTDLTNTGSNAVIRGIRYETNPNTTVGWTVAECDAVEAGIKQTVASGTQVAELMFLALVVEYTPATQYDATVNAKAKVQVVNDATVNAKAKVQIVGDKTFNAKAKIQLLLDATFNAKARVIIVYDKTFGAKVGWVQTALTTQISFYAVGVIGDRVPPIERIREWVAKTGAGTAAIRHLMKTGGVENVGAYDMGAVGVGKSQLFYHDWIENPVTELPWTLEDIDALQVGAIISIAGAVTRVNGVFVVLEHNEAHAIDLLFAAKAIIQISVDVVVSAKIGYIRVPGDATFGARVGFFGGHRTFPIGPVPREEPPLNERLVPSPNP